MKKYLVLMVIIFLLIPGCNVGADNDFKGMKVTEAINQLAEIKTKNVLYITEPVGSVSFELDLNKDFSVLLEEILSETNFQFVEHNDYYIIGIFSQESAEFANLAETTIYETKYLTPELLADKLDYPDVKIKPINKKNEILIQGLPADVKKVKDKIVSLDKKENFPQIQYELTLIDITEKSQKRLNLDEISLSSQKNQYFKFYKSNRVLEIILEEIINSMKISTRDTFEKSMQVASPGIVTEIDTTGSLKLTEELITLTEDETVKAETTFTTRLTPERLSSQGEIKTALAIDSSQGVVFKTNLWLESNKTELIGLFKINKSKVQTSLTGNEEIKNKRTYAVYITARPVSVSPAAKLNGLDKIIFAEYEKPTEIAESTVQLLADKDFYYDLDLFIQNDKSANIFTLKSRESNKYLELSYGLNIKDTLSADFKTIIEREIENKILLGMSDRVSLTDNFQFSAGYYPIVYLMDSSQFNESAGYLTISYNPKPILFNLRYNHNFELYPYRVETGVNISNRITAVIRVKGNKDRMDNVLAGIRYSF